ncbi:MAG: arsenate reductase family protein [Clostridia bacterium]|nr:arsenate reductase family protein [Clostridia bacterium]
MKVYCYDRCSTCRKALSWLDGRGIDYLKIDIKTEHPDVETLRAYVKTSGLPLKRFFNTSGGVYREMGLGQRLKDMPEEEQLALLASDGMLVKRPLAVGDDFVLVGFREEEWAAKVP